MIKVLTAVLAITLSGCTLLDAYLMTPYDPNEYDRITSIRNHAHQYAETCNDFAISKVNANLIANETLAFEMYSEHIPRNDDGYASAKKLNEIAQGVKKQYNTTEKVSEVFCKLKFNSITNSANLMQHTIGDKPR